MNNGIIDALSREGPNVNISLKKRLNLAVKECGRKSLVEIGSCNLHSAHNAFRHGMSAVPVWGIDEFVMDVFYWFKNYPALREDFHNLYSSITDEEISTSFLRCVDNNKYLLFEIC